MSSDFSGGATSSEFYGLYTTQLKTVRDWGIRSFLPSSFYCCLAAGAGV
jgi:hypothetical protein